MSTIPYSLVVPVPQDTPGWEELKEALEAKGQHLVSAQYQVAQRQYGGGFAGLEVTYFGTTKTGARSKRVTKDWWALSEETDGWLLHLIPSHPIRQAIKDLDPDNIARRERRLARLHEGMQQ